MEIPKKEELQILVEELLTVNTATSLKEVNKKMTTCGFETKLLGPTNTMRMVEEITNSGQLLYYWHQGRASSIQCRLVIESLDDLSTEVVKVKAIKF
ncbi:hypothetical protein [Brochothrix thermosphacta]|uniref:Uncharacterized protein n=1 Tax=Brochothrix thermosphacta TaxID=2756 RepID=A0A2X0QXV9_BROTH|nr:hypothetical protein [Brochothrix thermosphacta]ODJ52206.1 hypothetical protein BFR40_04890 [Brochothrix thermosphacta]ODJ58424.1 hypothetical protein BFR42_12130 [Brochothrix thermosphacta]SLN05853.1 hypothetical protein FM106_32275 [Brachybacterium faecium]SPP29028.1 hypothetical protein BTBSAS_40052 [Brochothrix thermosphacta]